MSVRRGAAWGGVGFEALCWGEGVFGLFIVCACCGGERSQSGGKVSDFVSLTNIKHYSNWRLLQMQVVVIASPHTSRKGE